MGRRRDTGSAAGHTTAEMALALPKPYEAFSDSPNLIDTERDDLAACEAAVDSLRLAFWAAGKALQIIRDGRLYRDGRNRSFEDYCEERFQLSRRQVDRLIQAWPLAEALATTGAATTLNEGQVRELVPLAERHGADAAMLVYATVAEDDRRVTAAVLAEAVTALEGTFDPATAADQIRAYLTRDQESDPEPLPVDPAAAWKVQTARLSSVTKTVRRPAFLDTARTRPEEAREFVTGLVEELQAVLRALADEETAPQE